MKVDWYDDVLLKDGREGCVIEIYKNEGRIGYEIELSDAPNDSQTVVVTKDQIEKVLRKNKSGIA